MDERPPNTERPPATTLLLSLDPEDWQIVQSAMRYRNLIYPMPDGYGNEAGRLIAEICRGWMERVGLEPDWNPERDKTIGGPG